jgi:hypothetical protein
MASEIKVDTIVNAGGDNDTGIDLATNDQILLKVANSTKLTMNSTGQVTIIGEGTATTNLQLGLVKLSASCSDSASLSEALNVSGGTDHGTGDYSYAPVSNFANNFMKYSGIVRNTSPGQVATRNNGRHDVSVIAYETANASGSNTDLSHEINVFGELA